jgi:hypothetical protein
MRVRVISALWIPAALLLLLAVLGAAGCGGDDPASPDDSTAGDTDSPDDDTPDDGDDDDDDDDDTPTGDTTAPAAVADLRVDSVAGSIVTIAWTAPGDDGSDGQAAEYDVRYSAGPITSSTWDTDTPLASPPSPAEAGTEETAQIDASGMGSLYVALKTADEVPNWSGLSNVATYTSSVPFEVHQLTSTSDNTMPCVSNGWVTWVRRAGAEGEDIWIANLEAASPTPIRLTDDGGEKDYPSSYGADRIVWAGRADAADDWEIFLYDSLENPPWSAFTDNATEDTGPVMVGSADFAWLQGSIMFESVHYWDAGGLQETVISHADAPTSTYSNRDLTGDDGMVAWRAFDRGLISYRAFLWETGAVTDITDDITANTAIEYSLDDGELAYESAGDWITYWTGSTPQTIAAGTSPSLDDGRIAYEVWTGHYDVHFWDGAAIHEITDRSDHDAQPSLDGDWLVWVGHPGGGDGQIFYTRVR